MTLSAPLSINFDAAVFSLISSSTLRKPNLLLKFGDTLVDVFIIAVVVFSCLLNNSVVISSVVLCSEEFCNTICKNLSFGNLPLLSATLKDSILVW